MEGAKASFHETVISTSLPTTHWKACLTVNMGFNKILMNLFLWRFMIFFLGRICCQSESLQVKCWTLLFLGGIWGYKSYHKGESITNFQYLEWTNRIRNPIINCSSKREEVSFYEWNIYFCLTNSLKWCIYCEWIISDAS